MTEILKSSNIHIDEFLFSRLLNIKKSVGCCFSIVMDNYVTHKIGAFYEEFEPI